MEDPTRPRKERERARARARDGARRSPTYDGRRRGNVPKGGCDCGARLCLWLRPRASGGRERERESGRTSAFGWMDGRTDGWISGAITAALSRQAWLRCEGEVLVCRHPPPLEELRIIQSFNCCEPNTSLSALSRSAHEPACVFSVSRGYATSVLIACRAEHIQLGVFFFSFLFPFHFLP